MLKSNTVTAGTSIGCVYEDSKRILSNVLLEVAQLSKKLAAILIASSSGPSGLGWIFNTSAFPRSHAVEEEDGSVRTVVVKGFAMGNTHRDSLDVPDRGDAFARATDKGTYVLENDVVRVEFSNAGCILSLLDKRVTPHREVLDVGKNSEGSGNQYVLYDDIPFFWDAWDVMPYHQMTGKSINGPNMSTHVEKTIRIMESHGHAVSLEFSLSQWGEENTSLTTRVVLTAGSPLIEFNVSANWHEQHKLLKVEFPLSIRSSVFRCETQYGYTERPTHANQPTDAAMFETCGHRFADLSETGYGVALLNDCKYGYSCRGSTLCMSLLRAPKAPDANCDMGQHTLRYSILPHLGSITELTAGSEVVKESALLNSPLYCFPNPEIGAHTSEMPSPSKEGIDRLIFSSLCELESPINGLVLDVMKVQNDKTSSSNDIILRFYESLGSRGTALLHFNMQIRGAYSCNMNEEIVQGLELVNIDAKDPQRQSTSIIFLPFQVVTVRIELWEQ